MVVMQWILNAIKKGQLKTFWLDTYSWHENTSHIPGATGSGMGAILSAAFLLWELGDSVPGILGRPIGEFRGKFVEGVATGTVDYNEKLI